MSHATSHLLCGCKRRARKKKRKRARESEMSHGLFSERLVSASQRYRGRYVIPDSGEPGTSGACSNCGYWDSALGGSKNYRCPSCGVHMDRDDNGWRGNLFAAYGKAVGIGWDGKSGLNSATPCLPFGRHAGSYAFLPRQASAKVHTLSGPRFCRVLSGCACGRERAVGVSHFKCGRAE